LKADFKSDGSVDERGCRRDIRSNGWIAFSKEFALAKTGPAEETSFLRSVRILRFAISPAIFAQVKSGPDVFADALVPCAAPPAPAR
jgi:hypothetical protein